MGTELTTFILRLYNYAMPSGQTNASHSWPHVSTTPRYKYLRVCGRTPATVTQCYANVIQCDTQCECDTEAKGLVTPTHTLILGFPIFSFIHQVQGCEGCTSNPYRKKMIGISLRQVDDEHKTQLRIFRPLSKQYEHFLSSWWQVYYILRLPAKHCFSLTTSDALLFGRGSTQRKQER